MLDVEVLEDLIERVVGGKCLKELVVSQHVLVSFLENRLITTLLTIDLLCQIMRLLNDLLSHQKALLISFIYEVLNHQNFRLDHKILPIVMLKNLTLLLCHFGVLFGILFLYFFVEFKSLADEPQLAF